MDFFSEGELRTQTGHPIAEWPLVIAKELTDNSLDACEEADIAPVVAITADDSGIAVADNGPGLPETTIAGMLDFTVRVSSREAYVAPDRGRQGNAMKTLLPMPWVLDPVDGRTIITAHGKRHVITCGINPITQRPLIHDEVSDSPKSKNPDSAASDKPFAGGTEVRLEWSRRDRDGKPVWPFKDLDPTLIAERFRSLVEAFALFNPHATFRLNWFGQTTVWEATDPTWKKWKAHQPTSAHWYSLAHLKRLVGACATADRDRQADRLVSDLITQFDGFSGSARRTKVLAAAGLKRSRLSALVAGDQFDDVALEKLLAALKQHSKPVTPQRLGLIGEDHLRQRLLAMGVQPESFRYEKKLGGGKSKNSQTEADDKPCSFELPSVLECAFGWLGKDARDERKICTGANWSGAINNPFRTFGATGEGLETTLAELRARRNEPVVFVLHLACPRIEYTDRGKSALVIEGGDA
jgi:hypothetical protein